MQLAQVVDVVGKVRATPGKLAKVALLADLLKAGQGEEIRLLALYLSGTLPQGRVGVGWRTLTELPPSGAGTNDITLVEIDRLLSALGAEQGSGSTARRAAHLATLFARVDEAGRAFLIALLMGELRQGALEGLVLEAVARAAGLRPPDVRQAAMFSGDPGQVAQAALTEGAAGIARFGLRLLTPVAPMLASTAEDVDEALERLGTAAFEYKLDGARIQVHKAGDEVRVFTRQLQDVTDRVPEVVEWARAAAPRELVVEGEAIALRADGRPHPFQVSMRRFGRSKDVAAARQELPLSFFLFDLLYLEQEGSLAGAPYTSRIERLQMLADPGRLLPTLVTADPTDAQRFLDGALEAGHEGAMAKALDAPYVAGQRGLHWLKLKSAHTLDLVVLAVEWGSGRRKGWLSNLHLGARDAESGRFIMLGKTFKGLTDEMLRWQTEKLKSLQTSDSGWVVEVRPELVVEIAFSDVQESPRYPAGLALRFARVKRYRADKTAAEADTLQTVRAIFERQRA